MRILLTDIRYLIRSKDLKRWIFCILTLTFSICLSGCWDSHELQESNFVLAVAIDKADEGLGPGQGEEVARIENFAQPHGSKRYRLSLQLLQLIPPKNTEESSRGKTATRTISTTGESMREMIWDLVGQSNKRLTFQHLQTIVISDAAIRQGGLDPILDFYARNEEIRWLTKVVITHGEARPLLEYKPPTGESSGMFIANSLKLYKKNPHVPGWHTDLGNIGKSQGNQRRVLIPRIELVDNVVKLGGMAIFKDNKFIDYIDEYATQGSKLMSGIEKSGIITFECPAHPEKVLAFEIFRHDTKLTPHVDNGTIYFTLDIAMRGNIGEMQCSLQHDTIEEEDMRKLEGLVAEAVKKNILYTFHIFQNLKVDGSVFGEKLQAFEPLVWDEVKEHWDDEVFPKMSLIISVNVFIENVGTHK